MGSFSKLKDIFCKGENFLLICHEQPDGDALGAILALSEGLKNNGKKTSMVCSDKIPEIFLFLPGVEQIKRDFLIGNFDVIILLDNGDLKRTGFPERILKVRDKGIPLINIDHHPKNDLWKCVTINYVNDSASSSSELVFEILNGLGWKITPTIATSLLTGIFYDTGGFQHTNTSPSVLTAVSELLNKGAKLKKISESISSSHSNSITRLKLWGIALNRLLINEKYGIASSFLLREDIEKLNASDDEVSGLVNLINAIPETQIALLLYETADGKIRGSLRTEKDSVSVSKLADLLGGGGHKKAAGFSFSGQIKQVNKIWQIA
ncbi:MAG: DHH family phosphoesterase [Patescibacteria group bacterium]|nr:DHH family phosphoesterase [Patescibacteria group bacterium]